MSVLQRRELEDSPLADLHAIAAELGIEGYRILRRDDLIGAILEAQGGEAEAEGGEAEAEAGDPASGDLDEVDVELEAVAEAVEPAATAAAEATDQEPLPAVDLDQEPEAAAPPADVEIDEDAEVVIGTLDILPNGSGFVRVEEAGQSSLDVYVSAAQIRRCELRAGDEVGGPIRAPRRSERHPSLVRIATVNGREPEPVEERPWFGDLTPVDPTERLETPPVLAAVPFGRGSRVAVAGAPGAGATRLLREIVRSLAERHPELKVSVVLVGARPEEVTGWKRELGIPIVGGSFDGSLEAQTQAAELAAERAKRVVERGGDAALVVDSLENLPSGAARRLFGAGRKLEEGGSLTVIAAVGAAAEPMRHASTRIALDATAPEPTVLLARSGTQRPDLLA